MLPKLHFLGWDGPVAGKVGEWLLGDGPAEGPVDFHDTLIVVPTLQAGRRLKETLALRCHARGSNLLSATVVTPHYFLTQYRPGMKAANPVLSGAVWMELLARTDLSQFSYFFPNPGKQAADPFQWAFGAGRMIEGLRHELADGGYGIADVISRHGKELQELERWKDLERLEKLYLQQINALGFNDACVVKMELAARPEIDPAIARIVVACVPDPTLLAVRALENLADDHAVEILVHAPASMADKFDEWGRPVAGEWARSEVEIPGWETNVFLEAAPDNQGQKVVEILSGLPAQYGPADIGIGVGDPAIIPFLEKELQTIHLPAFNPAEAPFKDHSLSRLIEAMFNLMQLRAYSHAADLLRHPDFLRYLEASARIEPGELLTQLDEFQNHYLPLTFEDMLVPFQSGAGGRSGRDDDFTVLGKALHIIKEHIDAFEKKPLEEAARSFLQSVYVHRAINPDLAPDRIFEQAAGIVEETFRELREVLELKLPLGKRYLQAVFLRRLQERTYSRERGAEVLDLQGWLELPWTDTPFLVVAGFNEEFVPGGSLSGVFLPDSLRKILKLRDDLSRFGRDVYLLKTMIESRRKDGRVCILAGKYSLSGDPLRPSRLLFRCPSAQLPKRAGRLFGSIQPAFRAPAPGVIFRLKPSSGAADDRILKEKIISVTAFRDYLACPFRFYLRRVLGMEPLSDDKTEPDALDFGTLVHEVLQVMGLDRGLWGCPDAGLLGKRLAALAGERMTARYGKNLPLGVLIALSSARARLEALAVRQVELAREGWEIIAVEQKKQIARGGFKINGKIDRVDRHRVSGAIRVIDYKTADTPRLPRAEHLARRGADTADYNLVTLDAKGSKKGSGAAQEYKWVDLQLPLYLLLLDAGHPFDSKVVPAYFNLPKAVSETGLELWGEFGMETLDSALKCIDGVLGDIARGKFWPPAGQFKYDEEFKALFTGAPDEVFDLEGFAQ